MAGQPKALKAYWAKKKGVSPKPEFMRDGKPSFFNPDDDKFNHEARKRDFEIMSNANKKTKK